MRSIVPWILATGITASALSAQSGAWIALQFARFDPLVDALEPPPDLAGGRETNVWIVQFTNRPTAAARESILGLGAQVHGYLPDDAHLVRMDEATCAKVRGLPFVRWAGYYHPAFRLEPALIADALAGSLPKQAYNLVLVDKKQDRPALVAAVAKVGGTVVHEHPGSLLVEAMLDARQLVAMAHCDQVLWIDRVQPRATDMNNARVQSGANYVEQVGAYRGQGVRGHIFEGIEASHPDFPTTPSVVLSCASANDHGHATAGIVFGNGISHPNARGMAPDVTPFYTNDLCQNPGVSRWQVVEALVNTHQVMFTTASWGNGFTTTYTSLSADADDIVFDHGIAWTQSMSNTGNQLSRPQAWAKNLFSIGAVRHFDTSTPTDDSWSNSGSRGPAADGRIKPDFVGYYDLTWTSDLTGPAGYSAGDHVADFGGTSGATPMVAGLNALVIQMFTDGLFGPVRTPGGSRFQNRPSFTTLKALQIVGAEQLPFTSNSIDNRREHQGWGYPNVRNLYDDRALVYVVDEIEPLPQEGVVRYRIQTAPGRPSLKIAMTYADAAANPAALQTRVNDLTLRAIAPDGTVYWGNHGLASGNWSLPGGGADAIDTVECIFVDQPQPGVWSVDVMADLVAADNHLATAAVDADFGLVVCGGTYVGRGTPGSVRTFGAGCPGSRPSPPAVCFSANDVAGKTSVLIGANTTYALEMVAPTDLDVTGFEVFVNSTIPQPQVLTAEIRYPGPTGAPSILVAAGSIQVETSPQWTRASVSPITVPLGQVFYVCITTTAPAPSLWDAASGGIDVPYFRFQNGAWSNRISNAFEWCVRIDCLPNTTVTPSIRVVGLPDLGQTYGLELSGVIAGGFSGIIYGVSDTVFGAGASLPYSLAPLGGGTCQLLVSAQKLALGIADPSGSFAASLTIPALPAFLGTRLYHQGFVFDAAANTLGLVLSNAVEVTLGG